jgi:hypothetical protein
VARQEPRRGSPERLLKVRPAPPVPAEEAALAAPLAAFRDGPEPQSVAFEIRALAEEDRDALASALGDVLHGAAR